MGMHDLDDRGDRSVDYWRRMANAARRAWPPARDWVTRWLRRIANAAREAWPPIRDFAARWIRIAVITARRSWPPTRDWIKFWLRRTANATQRSWPPIRDRVTGSLGRIAIDTRLRWRRTMRDWSNRYIRKSENERKPMAQITSHVTPGRLFSIFLIAIVVLGVSSIFRSCSSDDIPAYEVVSRREWGRSGFKVDAVVSGILTVGGLKQLLHKLYDDEIATAAVMPTHVFIDLYQSREHFESYSFNLYQEHIESDSMLR